jgi:hypothetical protein
MFNDNIYTIAVGITKPRMDSYSFMFSSLGFK